MSRETQGFLDPVFTKVFGTVRPSGHPKAVCVCDDKDGRW